MLVIDITCLLNYSFLYLIVIIAIYGGLHEQSKFATKMLQRRF